MENKNQLFAICKSKETAEYHIFKTHKDESGKCYFSEKVSLCGAMETKDKESCAVVCVSVKEIREKASEIGDTVCGNCMKIIYKTVD